MVSESCANCDLVISVVMGIIYKKKSSILPCPCIYSDLTISSALSSRMMNAFGRITHRFDRVGHNTKRLKKSALRHWWTLQDNCDHQQNMIVVHDIKKDHGFVSFYVNNHMILSMRTMWLPEGVSDIRKDMLWQILGKLNFEYLNVVFRMFTNLKCIDNKNR